MNDERHNTRRVPTDFPWRQIEDITNDFAPERKIGSGGYGVVYKGVHPNGQEVAVKKLHHMPGLDEDQFQNELRILTGICHPNIVQLVGKSYIERDRCVEHQGRLVFATMIDRAICLEFLPKGSLEKHLSDEQSGLDWHSRYKIIKGICDGLKYLHGEKIFHLDLKPSNILLDKDMVPKIADFGLSRLFSGTRQSHTTKNFLCTLGYAPPEFVDMGKITKKFDVFSLGVIIIKVLAGPEGRSIYSDMSTPQDFIDLVQGNWKKILEAGWKDASYLDAYCNQVKTCTEIALKCVESNSHKRPSIEDIITMLNETEDTIDKMHQQLFVVKPPHLCSPFEPGKLIPCPLQLTNNTDHPTALRTKLMQTEVDLEFLKRCCETLAEENRRLQRELQDIRALNLISPLLYTNLTMCPSCERLSSSGNICNGCNFLQEPPTNLASAQPRLKKFNGTIKKPRPPLLRSLPEQSDNMPWARMHRRSRRIASQSLSRIPVSKRGEYLVKRRLGQLLEDEPASEMKHDLVFGRNPDNMQFLEQREVGARKHRRRQTSGA